MVSFDPFDREILERAFDAALVVVKDNDIAFEFDSDEGLETLLLRELMEIACFNGVSDLETRAVTALSRCRRSVAVNVAGNRRHAVADAAAQVRNEPARSSLKCGRRSR